MAESSGSRLSTRATAASGAGARPGARSSNSPLQQASRIPCCGLENPAKFQPATFEASEYSPSRS